MSVFNRAALATASIVVLFAASPVTAQNADRMDQVVAEAAENETFMGSALVSIGENIVLNKGYGSANLEWNIPNSPDTIFRIGSVTKQFTAVSILLLQERGQLDIDLPVKNYWTTAPAAWDKITVRNLLNHSSGIPNITAMDEFGIWKYLPTTRDELIGRFADKSLDFDPGEKWAYSNSNYLVLTAIVEEMSGKSYEEFLTENIFKPLGMANTGIDQSDVILKNRASGYSPSSKGIVNAEYVNMAIPQGGGALYSTTGDLLKWQRGLFGGQILAPESVATFVKPFHLEAIKDAKYASGVLIEDSEEGKSYWHGGGIEGFNAWLAHDPEKNITVAVLANQNGGDAVKLGTSLMKLARGGKVELASAKEKTEAGLEARAK